MARVREKTKSAAGKPYTCLACNKPIIKGQKYYEWKPYRSTPRRKHAACGYPKLSETSTSKLATVYGAIEDAEATIATATEVEDIMAALDGVVESARDVASEYEEAMEAMGAAGEGGDMAERRDALESFADELESASSNLTDEEFEKEDSETPEAEQRQDWIEDVREQAIEALGTLEV